jgi:two-component system, OmpR family, alkaline phosphatase synthesis response regulator PhoP
MKTILVVDDEPPIVEIVALVLKYEGYEVLTAGNGREALACLERSEVHLVLSDMMMPVMDGRALCKHIEADAAYGSVPVVLMSSTLPGAARWLQARGIPKEAI